MEIARPMPLSCGMANHLHVIVNQVVMTLWMMAGVLLRGNKFPQHVSNCYILMRLFHSKFPEGEFRGFGTHPNRPAALAGATICHGAEKWQAGVKPNQAFGF
jgi:hypothetical protein